ncbi:MAG: MarR family transcriptional regulator [Eubacteriales bacterium]|nr:MarR family transcriptional regulator [Eubacteriales bacterium]
MEDMKNEVCVQCEGHEHRGMRHRHEEYPEGSLVGMLCRCGYIADRKSGRHRGQKRILQILLDSPRISQKELTEKLNIEPGSMSEVLSKLEDKGMVRRERDTIDRRKMMITLTKEGQDAAKQCAEGLDEDILEILSDEEKESLKQILGKLLEHWRAERRKR